jgi:hypothetical protein
MRDMIARGDPLPAWGAGAPRKTGLPAMGPHRSPEVAQGQENPWKGGAPQLKKARVIGQGLRF